MQFVHCYRAKGYVLRCLPFRFKHKIFSAKCTVTAGGMRSLPMYRISINLNKRTKL